MELDLNKGTVLAVDDQASDLLVVENALSDYYFVVTTTCPKEAITLAKHHKPSVVILDIEMPDIDGFSLCKMMQAMPELSSSSFIFITSHNDIKIETKALKLGASDFISKPIHSEICKLRVKSQMTIQQQSKSLSGAFAALNRKKGHLDTILKSIGDAVIATDNDSIVTFINPVGTRLTGFSEREALGRPISEVMQLQDAISGQLMTNPLTIALAQKRTVSMALNAEIKSKDGHRYRVEDTASPIFDANEMQVLGGVIVFQDVSDKIAMSTEMTHLINHDQLTGLPNRMLLHDRMLSAINAVKYSDRLVAALLIDLDNFKYINDASSHELGDVIIKQIATRLYNVGDESVTLARIGGDEFVLLLSDCAGFAYINQVLSHVADSINTPLEIDGTQHRLTASIGVSIFPTDAKTPEELIRHADTAMYKVKSEGKNGISFYANELSEDLKERVNIEQLLHRRLEEKALLVYFQPKFYLSSGELSGVEALVRMNNWDGSVMTPFSFIPIAEESGLIKLLGKEVLDKSCAQAKAWLDAGTPMKVAVNIGASQFNEFGFTTTVSDALQKHDLPSKWLELEITESALIQDINSAKKAIQSLQHMGISIALDDFGTGYSSLSYLRSFNFDVLKIDRSFIIDIETNEQALRIVKAILNLAESLNLDIVCEGIETEAQCLALKEMGCEQGQGYYFAYPQPASNLTLAFLGQK